MPVPSDTTAPAEQLRRRRCLHANMRPATCDYHASIVTAALSLPQRWFDYDGAKKRFVDAAGAAREIYRLGGLVE
jgi:hypothetical protein